MIPETIPEGLTFDDVLLVPSRSDILPANADTRTMVTRNGCALTLEDNGGVPRVVERAGILMDGGIAKLVDGGFQKFFLAPDGRKKPALASELKGVHEFQEDLREALVMTSLYN